MSQLDGFFSLRTPEDLLRKLETDWERLRAADPASVEAQYAAFDFFVTAGHMPEWLWQDRGGSEADYRTYDDHALIWHITNGAKHFRADPQRHTTVRDTRVQPGVFDANIFDPSVFDVPRLVVDLENGTSVPVMEVAERIVKHWRKRILEGRDSR